VHDLHVHLARHDALAAELSVRELSAQPRIAHVLSNRASWDDGPIAPRRLASRYRIASAIGLDGIETDYAMEPRG
jgi:hypothetical protein